MYFPDETLAVLSEPVLAETGRRNCEVAEASVGCTDSGWSRTPRDGGGGSP